MFVGDGRNNVAHTLLVGCAQMGVNVTIAAPAALQPAAESLAVGARHRPGTAEARVTRDGRIPWPPSAGADAVYTDVWVSMGEEEKSAERIAQLSPYQVNDGPDGEDAATATPSSCTASPR